MIANVLLVMLALARLLVAPMDVRVGHTSVSVVRGAVFDSMAHAPLADALVQLVSDDGPVPFGRTVRSDSLGQFEFSEVPAGRYLLGFFHPILDSLGLEPRVRAVTVADDVPVHADLAIPAPARIRTAICGPASRDNAGALVYGVVRDARTGASLDSAEVRAEWLEVAFARRRVVAFTPQKRFTTGSGGWYAFCNAPSPGTLKLSARRDRDSTDVIEVSVPKDGVLRRELFLGAASLDSVRSDSAAVTVATSGVVASSDSIMRETRSRDSLVTGTRSKGARLSGVVIASRDGTPLAGAQINIVGGPETRANDEGAWTIDGAPFGTRTLEVRAVGHYPDRRAVDVVNGAAPVRIALVTLKSILDTMKTVSRRRTNTNLVGFNERRRMGNGQFFGPEDVEKWRPLQTSDLFRQVRGMMLDRGQASDLASPFENRASTSRAAPAPENKFVMRGMFAANCVPTVFLNDHRLNDINAEDLDGFVRPKEIAGIEVYTPSQVPAQYQPSLFGCGAIVIWTR